MYTIANYLLDRLNEIGIKKLFGVPGDFNLNFLDYVIEHNEIEWIGNANELNAAYMADGYSRINGISACLTTYGVGELSAINGVAGSYAEDVPVIHIVGVPSEEIIINKKNIHHTLGNQKYDLFKKMYENITTFQIWLDNKNATNQIDTAIEEAIFHKKPVYIMIPTDIVNLPAKKPLKELNFNLFVNSEKINDAIDDLTLKINKAKQALIISGHKINSYGLNELLSKFVDKTNINIVSSIYGKGSIEEENKNFAGMFLGKNTFDENVKLYVSQADLIITIGVDFTDLSSSNWNLLFNKDVVFEINDSYIKYDNKTITRISMGAFLSSAVSKTYKYEGNKFVIEDKREGLKLSSNNITSNEVFLVLNEFIKQSDIIVSDIGTAMFGCQYLNLKRNSNFIMQPLWASIGFSFPAAIGAKLASGDKRVINVIGDGAFNMTLNEIGTIIKNKIAMILIVLNNNGYTIERVIHNQQQIYHDIPSVDYAKLIEAFDPSNDNHITYRVKTSNELYDTLDVIKKYNDRFIIVEICLESMDIPKTMENVFSK